MATFLLAFLVMATGMSIMAVGVILKNKPIKGTCASLSNLGTNGECVVCGKKADAADDEVCVEVSQSTLKASLYYVADAPQQQIKRS
jgi:hypothetical protein